MPRLRAGCGTTYRGARAVETRTGVCPRCRETALLGTYETREWLCLFHAPLVPLRRYRVKDDCAVCHRHQRIPLAGWRRGIRRGLAARRRAVERRPQAVETWLDLAAALAALGRGGEAERVLRDGLARHPGEARLNLRLGELLALGRDLAGALAALAAAAAAAPERASIRLARGRLLARLARLEQAVVELREARRLAPREAAPIFLLGECHARLGRWSEALRCFEELLGRRPELRRDVAILRRIGACKLALGYRLTPAERRAERRWWPFGFLPSPLAAEV